MTVIITLQRLIGSLTASLIIAFAIDLVAKVINIPISFNQAVIIGMFISGAELYIKEIVYKTKEKTP